MDIIQVGNVLLSIDCFRAKFCCDLNLCHGACCIEGNAGAPITLDEIMAIEEILPILQPHLSPKARQVIASQGIAYTDPEGDLVTSIVDGKDCVFTCYEGDTCYCAIEKAQCQGLTHTPKPISCWLYPLRLKAFRGGIVGINYNRWDICSCAVKNGKRLKLPLYKFLREPLIARFGKEWYSELELTAKELKCEGLL